MVDNKTDAELDEDEKLLLEALMMQDKEIIKDFVAHAGKNLDKQKALALKSDIIEALKTICDPEIMINIYDMGLIYNIEQKANGDVFVDMSLTAPGCPVAGILPQQAADAVALLDGVGNVEVKIVWEPAWTVDRLSDDAKAMMELF